MPVKQVAWNKATKVATVQADAAALPGGSVLAGKFEHEKPADLLGSTVEPGISHVLFQHIQEVLYKYQRSQDWSATALDMERVKIVDTTNTFLPGPALKPGRPA